MAKKKAATPTKASTPMGDPEAPTNEELEVQINALQTQVNTMQSQLSEAVVMLQQYGIWAIAPPPEQVLPPEDSTEQPEPPTGDGTEPSPENSTVESPQK